MRDYARSVEFVSTRQLQAGLLFIAATIIRAQTNRAYCITVITHVSVLYACSSPPRKKKNTKRSSNDMFTTLRKCCVWCCCGSTRKKNHEVCKPLPPIETDTDTRVQCVSDVNNTNANSTTAANAATTTNEFVFNQGQTAGAGVSLPGVVVNFHHATSPPRTPTNASNTDDLAMMMRNLINLQTVQSQQVASIFSQIRRSRSVMDWRSVQDCEEVSRHELPPPFTTNPLQPTQRPAAPTPLFSPNRSRPRSTSNTSRNNNNNYYNNNSRRGTPQSFLDPSAFDTVIGRSSN